MNILICVDDTDDLTKSTSTGKIADMIAKAIEKEGAKLIQGVTRHQLLLHDDIDYTSHNSSMCMELTTDLSVSRMKEIAEQVLKSDMADSSDPGLCFCVPEQLKDPDSIIAFGKRAQREVIQKQEAYDLAQRAGGIILEEYGGTGIGVIGAIAGIGLRMSGNDGTVRGGKGIEYAGQVMPVKKWKTLMNIEQAVDFDGNILSDDIMIKAGDRLKLAYLDHKVTLVAKEKDGVLTACKKKDLYENDKAVNSWQKPCDSFEEDNDLGECYNEGEVACWNCLYRRWTGDGYRCVK